MSRSIRSSRFSAQTRRSSASTSACSRGSSVFFQLDKLACETPNAAAAFASVYPGCDNSFTASRLKESSYVLRVRWAGVGVFEWVLLV